MLLFQYAVLSKMYRCDVKNTEISDFVSLCVNTADIHKMKHHLANTPRPMRAQLGISKVMPNFAGL